MPPTWSRDELAQRYLDQLPYPPYPVQEEALLAWFTSDKGILVCAPTGMGKTLIAQAALFEALHTGATAYYTTPLIALTEQKFHEMQSAAVRWGFSAADVGLVTGNRKINPDARILVVVAEILLNRLLHREAFDFFRVSVVVMDEFHSFADPERGIVWELTLNFLPASARLLLLSATVGNAAEFIGWLARCHGRSVELVESRERRVPLTYRWVPDQLLTELLVDMAKGDAASRLTPALVFAFNRDECWNLAEQLKGLPLVGDDQRQRLHEMTDRLDWRDGVGPKLKQMLRRGVGIHHAGLLPKYRRGVESLFEQKLLAVAVCTETLAAGINLPARSVVLSSLVKGPFGKQKMIEASTAHQIFGRAGRPQYDDRGYVFAVAHEDDVKILRWKEKYDAIPEETRDPALLRAKKELKRKKPSRRENQQYWSEAQFKQLQAAPPGKLYSKGPLPWRLLAYLLTVSPKIAGIRAVIHKRLMDERRIRASEAALERMLQTLDRGGFVALDPPPGAGPDGQPPADYRADAAVPTAKLEQLLAFRSIHPLYGAFLVEMLGSASRDELIQAFESSLQLPRPVLRYVRVPFSDELPPGPLEKDRLDPELIQRGLIAAPLPAGAGDADEEDGYDDEPFEHPPALADKLRLLFEARYPEVGDLQTQAVWAAGELLRFGGNFNKFIASRDLGKQEGIIFRHLLRLILLLEEFAALTPPDTTTLDWQTQLRDLGDRLTAACRNVDPLSTDELIQQARAADFVEAELPPLTTALASSLSHAASLHKTGPPSAASGFAAGLEETP